jgi:hypothetical protein
MVGNLNGGIYVERSRQPNRRLTRQKKACPEGQAESTSNFYGLEVEAETKPNVTRSLIVVSQAIRVTTL